MFQQLDLFVYSGTGNTFKVAQCLRDFANRQGLDCSLSGIDAHSKPQVYQPSGETLLGLLAPTIGTIQPPSFFRFIRRLPKGNRQCVFLVATGAWTRIGPLFIPGYVGFGLYFAALLLLIKGYRIIGINGFGMAQNWTTLIPPYRASLEQRINKEIVQTTEAFLTSLLNGKRVYRRIVDLVVTLLIFPLPLVFLLLGHRFLAKTMFASSRCNGCGLCAERCPRNAIRMRGGKQKRPFWTFSCEQCMRCAGYCPQHAVESNTLVYAAFVALYAALPIEALLLTWFRSVFGVVAAPFWAALIWLLANVALLLLGAVISDGFFLLGGVPAVNRFYTFVSFSRFWRKYRQSGVSVAELAAKPGKPESRIQATEP